MGRFHDVIHDLRQPTRDLRAAIPSVWAGFSEMHQAAMADGVLPGPHEGVDRFGDCGCGWL